MTVQMAMMFPELATPVDHPGQSFSIPNVIAECFGARLSGCLTQAFGQIDIAWQELDAYKEKHADAFHRLDSAFLCLRWQLDISVPDPVYRHHVQELLQRVVDRESLKPGTDAEALMALHATSLNAPLTSEATVVALDLFERIYGEVERVTDHDIHEPWPGAGEELLAGLHRKLTRDRGCTT